MNKHESGQLDMIEKLIYTAFEKRLTEVCENVPHAIEIIKVNSVEYNKIIEERLEAIENMEEETVDTLLNYCVTYFMRALLFHVADESFFDEENVAEIMESE